MRFFEIKIWALFVCFSILAISTPAQCQDDPFEQFDSMPNEKTDFPMEGYEFPVLIDALRHGEFSEIPDDDYVRKYMASIFKQFNENCGEASTGTAVAAARYGSKLVRKAMKKPFEAFAEQLMGQMGQLQAAMKGDIATIDSIGNSTAMHVREGVKDGKLIIQRHQCGSQAKKIRENLHKLMRERHNQQPEPEDSDRLNALRKFVDFTKNPTAQNLKLGCEFQFLNKEACRCLAKGIIRSEFSPGDLELFSASFSQRRINRMKQKYPEFENNISTCDMRG